MTQIRSTKLVIEREPLKAPWGFKGGYLTELWQAVVGLQSDLGHLGVGLGVQSVLWSDSRVFAAHSEADGNLLMQKITEHAVLLVEQTPFETPTRLLDSILSQVHAYGKEITGLANLRLTFALNALVAVDNAAWLLYAAEQGITQFDELIPIAARPALSHRLSELTSVPAIGYAMSIDQIVETVREGYFVLKIKVGADPDQDGDPEKMLAADIARMQAIHEALREMDAPGSPTGRPQYYLDANGRYDTKERILKLLGSMEASGALNRTLLLEEPFPEEVRIDVRDIPVCVVADESAHTDRDALERIHLGYGAIALKPIAKTLSMSFKMAEVAFAHGVPCFCADLTVNPTLVDWNKTFAARLAPLPGMSIGLMETNGHQNYRDWPRLQSYHSAFPADWMEANDGLFKLDAEFYASSGGLFTPGQHYVDLVRE